MKYAKWLALALSVMLLAACYEQPQAVEYAQAPQYQAQGYAAPVAVAPAPVVVQNSNDGLVTGMLIGHMLSSGGSGGCGSCGRSTVVNRTVVNKTVVNKTYVNRPAARSSFSSSSFRSSSSFGGGRRR